MKKEIILIALLFLISCSGSASYPVRPGNGAFSVGSSSEIGVLLAHGLGSSPYELRELAQYLEYRNITVSVVRLRGHGTDIKELDKTKWQEWYEDYESAFEELSKKTKKVFVGGHSLGGALALYLAEQKETDGVISIASPIGLKDKRAEYAWLLRHFKKYEPRNLTEDEKTYNYDHYSAAAVGQLVDFIGVYKKNLSEITEPVLIMQLENETRIYPDSASYISENVRSNEKKVVLIPGTGHDLLEEPYEKIVYEEVYNFVKRRQP